MMKFVGYLIVLGFFLFLGIRFFTQEKFRLYASEQENKVFSFKEIEAIEPFNMKQSLFLQASDGVQLAYYNFTAPIDKNIVILYAGAGLYGNKTYQWVAKTLHEKYGIGVYIFDIRGHGHSQGARGDAPCMQRVWDDVAQEVKFVKTQHHDAKIYVVGHSSGAGLIINYAAHTENKLEDGYIFLAPYLGPQSGVLRDHAHADESFVKNIRSWVYALGLLFPHSSMIHWDAVFFNYPVNVLQADPLIVSSYTYVMSCATTPYDITTLCKKIDKPTAIFIGSEDEQFIPEKVIAYQDNINASAYAEIIKDAGHLSILLQAPQLIANFINT